MKQLCMIILMASMIGAVALTACCDCPPGECWDVLTESDFSQEMWKDFFAGRLPDVVLESSPGMELPLNAIVKEEFLSLEAPEQIAFRVKIFKKCVIRCTGKTCLFSTDFEEWFELSEFFK